MRTWTATGAAALLLLMTACTGSDEDPVDGATMTTAPPARAASEPVRTKGIPGAVDFGPYVRGGPITAGDVTTSAVPRALEPCPNSGLNRFPADRGQTAVSEALVVKEGRRIDAQLSAYASVDYAARFIREFAQNGVTCPIGGRFHSMVQGAPPVDRPKGVDEWRVSLTRFADRSGPVTTYGAAARVANAVYLISITEAGHRMLSDGHLNERAQQRLRREVAAAAPGMRVAFAPD